MSNVGDGWNSSRSRITASRCWCCLLGVDAIGPTGWIPQFLWLCALSLASANAAQWLIESRLHTAPQELNATAADADLARLCDGAFPVWESQIQAPSDIT